MAKSRRANAVVFGFDFQVNAAIVLMIENIEDLKSLRLEGNYEDIEIELENNQYILAQAKAVERSSSDFRNVRKNLEKSLISLSEGNQKVDAQRLILITNSPNPLNEEASRSIFWGDAHREFLSLPESSQELIRRYLDNINQPLDTDKFMIQILPFETDNDTVNQLLLRKKRLKSELRRIDNTLSDNRRFKKFVADMKLLVQAPDGSTFPVTENNIVGLNDAIDLLIAKRKMVSKEFATVSGLLDRIEKDKDKEYEQLEFYKSASQLEIFDKRIARMPMNPVTIDQEIKRLDKEIKSIRTEINNITRNNNSVVSAISKNVIKYAEELGLGNKETIPASYLFTSNLKELSGAVLHKTAFAFRLAYITVIEDTLKIKLPIILDSPSGKEVDQANIKLMMDILKRDFADHQIIIASIFNYDFDEAKIIEIKERLITENSL